VFVFIYCVIACVFLAFFFAFFTKKAQNRAQKKQSAQNEQNTLCAIQRNTVLCILALSHTHTQKMSTKTIRKTFQNTSKKQKVFKVAKHPQNTAKHCLKKTLAQHRETPAKHPQNTAKHHKTHLFAIANKTKTDRIRISYGNKPLRFPATFTDFESTSQTVCISRAHFH